MDTSKHIKKCPRCDTEIEPKRYATTGDKILAGIIGAGGGAGGAVAGFAVGGPIGAIAGATGGYVALFISFLDILSFSIKIQIQLQYLVL